jgi:hypothetical protein
MNCHDFPLTSSAPSSGYRELYNNLPKILGKPLYKLPEVMQRLNHDIGYYSRFTANQKEFNSILIQAATSL